MAKKKKNKNKKTKGQLGKKKETAREKMIGQSIGYRYDVNLLPDYSRITPFLKKYVEAMGWDDLNWLEDVHMGYEDDRPAVFDRNANGWVTIPKKIIAPKQITSNCWFNLFFQPMTHPSGSGGAPTNLVIPSFNTPSFSPLTVSLLDFASFTIS